MSYAQKDYQDKLGNNGTDTIAEAGSLLTAFANLLERFGHSITPAMLNEIFKEDGVYLHEDEEVRDKLAYSSISAYDSTIGISPNSRDNAIMRIDYESGLTGGTVSTFALVDDWSEKTIIDSYDGVSKPWSIYGEPVTITGYARYFAIANTPLRAPVSTPEATPDTYAIHSAIYGIKSLETHDGTSIRVEPGNYFVFDVKDDLINITATVGQPGAWIDINDNVIVEAEETPVEREIEETPPTEDESFPVPVRVVDWPETYTKGLGVVEYTAKKDLLIKDVAGVQADRKLPKDTIVPVAGTFRKDGVVYGRTEKSATAGNWYGVPMNDLTKQIDESDIDDELAEILNSADPELEGDFDLTGREKSIKLGATLEGKAKKLKNALHIGRK